MRVFGVNALFHFSPLTWLNFLLLVLIVFHVSPRVVHSCNVHLCLQEYGRFKSLREGRPTDPYSSHPHLKRGEDNHEADQPLSESSSDDYCAFAEALNQCTKLLSKSCRGDLQYHTVTTLIKQSLANNNCSIKTTPRNRKAQKPSSSLPTNMLRKKETSRKLKKCLKDAQLYSSNKEKFAYLKDGSQNGTIFEATKKTGANPIKKNGYHKQRSKNRMSRDTSDPTDYDYDGKLLSDNDKSRNVPKGLISSKEQTPHSACIIYGHPHLKSFYNHYQTCHCQGAWPLIEHPLFAIQITNSQLKENRSGITKVTVLVRQFHGCEIPQNILYEAEVDSSSSESFFLPKTFTDGTCSTINNIIRLEHVSENLVTLHLDHIGIEVVIGSFKSQLFAVAIKMKASKTVEQRKNFLSVLSNNSLCRSGCPLREQIFIKRSFDMNTDNSTNALLHPECSQLFGYYKAACLHYGGEDISIFKFGQDYDSLAGDEVYLEYLERPADVIFSHCPPLRNVPFLSFIAFLVNISRSPY